MRNFHNKLEVRVKLVNKVGIWEAARLLDHANLKGGDVLTRHLRDIARLAIKEEVTYP